MERTTVYLTKDLKARVARAARRRNVSEAELVRAAIDEYTRASGRPAPTLPLFASGADPDLAERVDEILAEGFGAD